MHNERGIVKILRFVSALLCPPGVLNVPFVNRILFKNKILLS